MDTYGTESNFHAMNYRDFITDETRAKLQDKDYIEHYVHTSALRYHINMFNTCQCMTGRAKQKYRTQAKQCSCYSHGGQGAWSYGRQYLEAGI